jgi:hypothetical protein
LSIGGGLYVGEHWRLDALYAHLFASSVTSIRTPRRSRGST